MVEFPAQDDLDVALNNVNTDTEEQGGVSSSIAAGKTDCWFMTATCLL